MGKKSLNKRVSNKPLLVVIVSIMVCLIAACDKSGVNCISTSGKTIMQERIVGDFDTIDLEDNVNLILKQDTAIKVIVESGQNIIDGITTEVNNRTLTIHNLNICNWMRSYDVPLNVYVSVKNLSKIYYNSSGDVSTQNALISRYIMVEAWGGAGTIDLNLDIFEGYFVLQMGTSDFNLRGSCAIVSFYSGDYGLIDAKDLKSRYTYVTNMGSNDVYVNSSHYMEATISSIGNIYYTGTPDTVKVIDHGEGEVIPF
jgi:hypothetical protein